MALLLVDVVLAWVYTTSLLYPGCVAGAPVFDEYDPQPVDLSTSAGTLTGWFYPSQNGAAVIAVGGLGASPAEALPPMEILLSGGYGVLVVTGRNCADPPEKVSLGYREIEEIHAAQDYLEAVAGTQPERIGIYGFSMGGVGAIRAAARDEGITAVIAEGGFFNLGDDLVEPGSGEGVLRKIYLYTIAGVYALRAGYNPWRNSPIDDLSAISPRPVLLIYGEEEAMSGRAEAQFAAAKEPKQLWIVPGGAHGTNHVVDPEGYATRVLRFYEESLGK